MAGRIQWCPDAQMLTGTLTATPAVQTDYPASWLQDRWHPLRATRSVNLSQQQFDLDLGASKTVYAVGHEHFNGDQLQVLYGTASPPATHFTGSPFSTPTALKKDRDGIRKHLIVQTVTARYLRWIIPAHSPASGEAYFFLGTLFVAGAWNTLSNNPNDPIRYQRVGAYEKNEKNNRKEVVKTGYPVLHITWAGTLDAVGEAEWRALEDQGQDAPLLYYQNEDRAEEMYWVRLDDDSQYEDFITHKERPLTWRTLA